MPLNDMLLLDNRMKNLVLDFLPNGKKLDELVLFFSAFADTTRLKILSALAITAMCVTDLSKILALNQTTISHQLKVLKLVGAVSSLRQGKIIFYQIANEKINEFIEWGLDYLEL